MTRFMRVSLLALVGVSRAAGSAAPPEAAAIEGRVDAYLTPYVTSGQFSGVVLIARGGNILALRAVGSLDHVSKAKPGPGTLFPIASLSKAFTAALVVKLAQEGRLSFDDPLSRFYPSFPNGANITIDQLLRHTSGVGEFDTPEVYVRPLSLDRLAAIIAQAPPGFPPGSQDQYSNEGYVLLAKVIEAASGMPYRVYLDRVFVSPLALRSTGVAEVTPIRGAVRGGKAVLNGRPVSVPRDEAPLPGASGLVSTAGDLLRWMKALRAGGIVDYRSLRYPYGWGRRNYAGHTLIEQSGSVEGFGSYMATYDDGSYVVCLSNIQSGMQGRWGPDFATVIYGGTTSTPPSIRTVMISQNLSDLAGRYKNAEIGNPLVLEERGDRMWLTWGSFPFWQPLSQLDRDRFFAVSDYSVYSFQRDGDGRVSGLRMNPWGADEASPQLFVRK